MRKPVRLPFGLQRVRDRLARRNRQRVLTEDFFDASPGAHLIDSELFQEECENDPLVLVDGGARGDLFAPFDGVDPARLFVVRFEPDPDATVADAPGSVTIKKGLWREPGTIDLYVAQTPSASSVFPPDEALLRLFPDDFGYPPRRTQRKIPIEVDTIDRCSDGGAIPNPDFIKLDVHGAEYEALLGASSRLQESVLAVLVESWALPIHRGQRTHGAVESLLNDHGFYLQKQRVNSLWPRKHPLLRESEDTIVAYESLYCRDPFAEPESEPEFRPVSAASALKAISIAELFRLPVLALQLNDASRRSGVLGSEQCEAVRAFIAKRYN